VRNAKKTIHMRKNGSRLISYKQYRTTDLFLFAAILAVAELTGHFATVWFPSEALYTFSFIVPISLIIMVRWGWQSIFFALESGLMYCLLNSGDGRSYLVYLIGNAFIMLMMIPLKLIGASKISSKWYFSALFVVGGWLCVYLGRAVVWTICYAVVPVDGVVIYAGFVNFAMYDLLSLIMAMVIVLALRRFDGMFENQKSYLKRIDKERRDRMRPDEFGLDPVEIDEESLGILNKDTDLYR
jgi:hypothetical protein